MNEIANQLVQVLFKKNSLQDCSRWELEILADKYPYFGIAQLLVSEKLKEENKEDYEKQVQKTSLYFTNPLWLDYILNKKNGAETTPEQKKETKDFSTEIEIKEQEAINNETAGSEAIESVIETAGVTATQLQDEPVHEIKTEERAIEPSPAEAGNEEIKIAPLKTEPLDENAPLAFEPYHTVDYFASQGIKLSLEEKPQDKFGQQLKSFTQWLKTIKKLPATEIAKEAAKVSDPKVVTLAEHSIEDREVVTETMAEVWVKQGNKEKAIEVYHKLSLQNPSKSSYFAGLIEQLKQH
jgi:hypothetical protein